MAFIVDAAMDGLAVVVIGVAVVAAEVAKLAVVVASGGGVVTC